MSVVWCGIGFQPVIDPGIAVWFDRLEAYPTLLSAGLFDLSSTLADFESWVALANHVDSASSLDDLAIGVAVLQRAYAANNFHRIALDRCFVYGLV